MLQSIWKVTEQYFYPCSDALVGVDCSLATHLSCRIPAFFFCVLLFLLILSQFSINPSTLKAPWSAVKSLGICSTCDVITINQERTHLCPSCRGGWDLSNETESSVFGLKELEICILKGFQSLVKAKAVFCIKKFCLQCFETILAVNRPWNVKNVLKIHFWGKTSGFNGLIHSHAVNGKEVVYLVYGTGKLA